MRSQCLQHLARGFEMRRRVVITGDHDHRAAALTEKLGQEIVVLRLGGLGRVGRIENVTGDNQQVHRLVPDCLQEEAQEEGVLLRARVLAEHLAQMPVRRVEHAVGSRRLRLD